MKHILLLSCGALLLFSSCTTSEGQTETATETTAIVNDAAKTRIDSTLQAYVTDSIVAGASALVYEDGKEVYYNAFGMADQAAGTPMDRNTIVQIFSMTKPITGVALMTLYEDGKFQLDDPLSKYAPEFADMQVYAGEDANGEMKLEPAHREITIRDITRHTAGFANSPDNPGVGPLMKEADPMNRNNTLTQMAEKLGRIPLWFQPGTQWAYGLSVDVQAFLVERLAEQPFDEYVREHVLDPLGMDETRYVVPESDQDRFAALYQHSEDGMLVQIPDDQAKTFNTQEWPLTPGGFGFTSTLDDYMRFAQMLVNEGELEGTRILKPETVKLMATNQLADSVTERSWLPSKGSVGFGIDFAVREQPPQSAEENHGKVGEFFWDGAASTLFWVDPANDLTAVLFVQIFPFNREIHKDFRDAVYGKYIPDDMVSNEP
uniref:Serine hydrolase n=1 Tax=Roseihalotalea indica TaxID=2867963 RepID=A0AA49GIH4_9BACT|nr:serine hydrolase [Tunicatimonas sp. TK19036]